MAEREYSTLTARIRRQREQRGRGSLNKISYLSSRAARSMNADDICKAFCRPIALHSVPIGYALRTPFRGTDGDPITVYIRREETTLEERFRLEDDGQTIGFSE